MSAAPKTAPAPVPASIRRNICNSALTNGRHVRTVNGWGCQIAMQRGLPSTVTTPGADAFRPTTEGR